MDQKRCFTIFRNARRRGRGGLFPPHFCESSKANPPEGWHMVKKRCEALQKAYVIIHWFARSCTLTSGQVPSGLSLVSLHMCRVKNRHRSLRTGSSTLLSFCCGETLRRGLDDGNAQRHECPPHSFIAPYKKNSHAIVSST